MTSTTDPQALRDRIAETLARADGWEWAAANFRSLSTPASDRYRRIAEAVLAVLPEQADQAEWDALCRETGRLRKASAELVDRAERIEADVQQARADRATVLREAAAIAESLRQFEPASGARKSAQVSENVGILRVAEFLRALAAETQQAEQPGTEAQPPRHRWSVETRDGVADEWAPGTRFLNRHHAVERYEALNENHPTWKDGTPVERRLVRETTSYTVEDAAP